MDKFSEFFSTTASMIKDCDVGGLAVAAEMPHTIVSDTGSHVFRDRDELRCFLRKLIESGGTVNDIEIKIQSVRPYGENLYFVDLTTQRTTERYGVCDPRNQFTVLRDTGEGLRVVASNWAVPARVAASTANASPQYSATS